MPDMIHNITPPHLKTKQNKQKRNTHTPTPTHPHTKNHCDFGTKSVVIYFSAFGDKFGDIPNKFTLRIINGNVVWKILENVITTLNKTTNNTGMICSYLILNEIQVCSFFIVDAIYMKTDLSVSFSINFKLKQISRRALFIVGCPSIAKIMTQLLTISTEANTSIR